MGGYCLEGTFIGQLTAERLGAMYYNFRNLVLNILETKFLAFSRAREAGGSIKPCHYPHFFGLAICRLWP
jgi:hypothetical protein